MTTVDIDTFATAPGRTASFRTRLGATFAVVAGLHVAGLALLALTMGHGNVSAVTWGMASFAYTRGLLHSFDVDHISMIDNSTRKFVGEGRRPASVGLAFSAGHSSVVIATGILVVAGAGFVHVALDQTSGTAHVLGVIGLSVSGLYLLLAAMANSASFLAAWRLKRQLRRNPRLVVPAEALHPRGLAARILAAPLRRVTRPRHVFVIGLLFSLGFDTSSQIGLLMLTGVAALAGAPAVALLSLPLLFAAAMTLGDTLNGLLMLKMYETAVTHPARRVTFNLIVTGISICSGLGIAAIALATLLSKHTSLTGPFLSGLAQLDTTYAGFVLAGLFVLLGAVVVVLWRTRRILFTA